MSRKENRGGPYPKPRNLPLDLLHVPSLDSLLTLQFFHFQDNCHRKTVIGHWQRHGREAKKEKYITKERRALLESDSDISHGHRSPKTKGRRNVIRRVLQCHKSQNKQRYVYSEQGS